MSNGAKLPAGIELKGSVVGVPFGAGRPTAPDPSSKAFQARAEIARAQGASPGRPTIFYDGDELWNACVEFFTWCDDNPWLEQKVQFSSSHGKWAKTDVNKPRPYTQNALCAYIGIPVSTWRNWRNSEKFAPVVELAEQVMYTQKFEGASAGFFNANIIARDLGLADKTEVSGVDGAPIEQVTSEMTPAQAAELYRRSRDA